MSLPWEVAQKENRRELVLHGSSTAKLLADGDGALPDLIWQLQQLNFLEASNVGIQSVSHDIANLTQLSRLCLRDNKLSNLPVEMNKLEKLNMLDVSGNILNSIDKSMLDTWKQLTNLNLSGNQFVALPSFDNLTNLQYLNVANNKLQALPDGLSNSHNLLVLEAQCNQLELLPDEVTTLVHLKQLYVYSNKLTELPNDLSKCVKLKDFRGGGNIFSDKRLRKMTEDSKTSSSAIMEYLRKQGGASGKGKGKSKGKSRARTSSSRGSIDDEGECQENVSYRRIIAIQRPNDDGVVIQVSPDALNLRPYLVCCVVRNFQLNESNCRLFIKFQENLHANMCKNRQSAAIGAHDMKSLIFPLKFVTAPPTQLPITPLGGKEDTAYNYLHGLRQQANLERKRLKRDKVSGVHKYLWLVDDEGPLVHMRGSDDLVLSIPPITNCDQTRLTGETRDLLLEVSGGDKLDVCKSVMDKLVLWLVEHCADEKGALTVEQTRVINADNSNLRVMYPSVTDLQVVGDGVCVQRP